MFRITYLLLLFGILFSCTRSGMDTRDLAFIKGKWTTSGALDSAHAWLLEYTFTDESFSMTGYPPISRNGKFRLKTVNEEEYKLNIYDQTGDPPPLETDSMQLIFNRKDMTLFIDGTGPFHKSEETEKH